MSRGAAMTKRSQRMVRDVRAAAAQIPTSALRLILLESVWEWVSRSHATFPEHDHHCPVTDAKDNDTECSCGYAAARVAMEALDTLERQ
jgi:hypothetical protein